jgi:drug/metabolite transporter (DMT)-like permease
MAVMTLAAVREDHERMHPRLSRIAGIALLLLGIAVVLWRVFGSPRDWEGDMRWLRSGLMLGALGAISLSARLIFPGVKGDAPDELSEKDDGAALDERP